jgi:cytokinin riboside 5'-monophosphate phosphoribohydrolase
VVMEASAANSKRICVFCSSSDALDRSYYDEARRLGIEIARRGHRLIYGGGNIGLVGALASAAKRSGGRVVGVIPHALNERGLGFQQADELIVTETMRERKGTMEENSDAFIALPGGLGTLEELLEIVTLKQLRYHAKPIVILNSLAYYDPLLELLRHAVDQRFMKRETLDIFHVSENVVDALNHIETYKPKLVEAKWMREIPPSEADVAVE